MFIGLLSVCTLVSFSGSLVSHTQKPSIMSIFKKLTISSCNTIDDPYAWVWVPNKIKDINVNVFNLMLSVNETRFLVWHELCEYKCGLNESVCNSKQ